jgi:hypothetical protein
MNEENQRELADDVYERHAKELFPYRDMSPERYAARCGLGWKIFSFGSYRYKDIDLDKWLQRLAQILASTELIEQYQQEYLTDEEMEEVRKEEESWLQESEEE